MSKLDELIARWDGETGERIWDTESFADECIAELRRLQVRERRMEELEARWVKSSEALRKSPANYFYIARAEGLEIAADDLHAIREET